MNENPSNGKEMKELSNHYYNISDFEASEFWFNKAFEHYTKDADGGDVMALFNLHDLLMDSLFACRKKYTTEILCKKAKNYLVGAASNGCREAQYKLADYYEMGIFGYPKDMTVAGAWRDIAGAEGGAPDAMFSLGLRYYNGNGVSQDGKEAREWIAKAAAQGHEKAREALKRLDAGKSPGGGGCYVATCVYGSYDCPQVWVLRRYRDTRLSTSWFGRLFIRIYYAASPKAVELFGGRKWFTGLCKPVIDRIVRRLQNNGIGGGPYLDA